MFFQVVERTSDLILIVRAGRIVYANPAFAAALGYSRDELEARPAVELAHPDERGSVRERIAATLGGGSPGLMRRRLLRRDGSVLTVEASTFQIDFDGPSAVLVGHDLTDRLRIEEQQRRKDDEYRELFRALPGVVAVFSKDERGTIRYVNDEAARALLLPSADAVVGASIQDYFDPAERDEETARGLERAARDELVIAYERRLIARDGTRRVMVVGACTVTFEGEPARLAVGYDVTAQREAERRAAAVMTSAPLAIMVVDEDLRVLQWNARMADLMQWTDSPALRPQALPEARALVDRARLHGHAEERATIDPRGGRPAVPVLVAAAPLRLLTDRAPSGYVIMMLDMREEERAKAALSSTTETLRAIFDASPQAILALDPQGNVTQWSDAAEWILGRTAREALGRPAPFLEAAEGPVRAAVRRAVAGEMISLESVLQRTEHPVELSLAFGPLRDGAGRPLGCVVVAADVTERRKLERQAQEQTTALLRAGQEWQATFDTVDAAVLVLEPQGGTISRMNRAAAALVPDSAGAMPLLAQLVGSEPWRTIAEALPQVSASRQPQLRNAHEGRRTWLVSISAPKAWPGSGDAVIVLARDVSEFVALQDTLRKSEAMSAIGALVAGVAHEVRNPLFAMSATVDAMHSRLGVNPATEPFLEALHRELDRLNTLMRDLLEYGRPSDERLSREPLGPVLAAALRVCQPLAERAQVRLENAVADAGEVAMDSGRLLQVFQNLIDNAIRHSPAGSAVRLEAAAAQLPGREAIEIRVLDQGPGFNAQDLPRVFEPFFTRRRGGIGLGLSIVQKITEQHGGIVQPRNRPQGGASVSVVLPR